MNQREALVAVVECLHNSDGFLHTPSRISEKIPGPPYCRKNPDVRGTFVKGMEKGVFRIIPLTIIPLTSLRPFPSSILALVEAFGAVFFAAKSTARFRVACFPTPPPPPLLL
jgi:hypothetical protein